MKGSFYTANIDAKAARNEVFKEKDGSKIIQIRAKTYTTTIGKTELTVIYKPGPELKDARYSLAGQYFDPEESVPYILSREEAADRIDPNRTSDAFMFGGEMLDTEKVAELSKEEALDRYAWFVAVCNRLSDEAVLQYIAEQVPKKKNGTLAKNKVTIIAAFPVVFGEDMIFYTVDAKAKDDVTLMISVRRRTFSEYAWLKVKDSEYLHLLSGEKPQKESSPPKEKTRTISIWDPEKKHTWRIPVIKLDDGNLAFNAKPYRAISSFKCVAGNDKTGYCLVFPANRSPVQVDSLGKTILVGFDLETSCLGCRGFWDSFSSFMKYYGSKKTKDKDGAVAFSGNSEAREVYDRALTEEYISENIYQFLNVIDAANAMLQDPSFVQTAADRAKRKKSGDLTRGVGFVHEMPVVSSIAREVPIMQWWFSCSNESDSEIRICLKYRCEREDMWTTT